MSTDSIHEVNQDLPDAVIFDLDGTLVDVADIAHLIKKEDPTNDEYDLFHGLSENAPEVQCIADQARALRNSDIHIIILSARYKKYYPESEGWLKTHHIPYNQIILRKDKNEDPLSYKAKAINDISQKYRILRIYEDQKKMIAKFRSMGHPVIPGPGY